MTDLAQKIADAVHKKVSGRSGWWVTEHRRRMMNEELISRLQQSAKWFRDEGDNGNADLLESAEAALAVDISDAAILAALDEEISRGGSADAVTCRLVRRLSRPAPAPVAVPDGFVLVPVEPTPRMIGAGIEAYDGKCESAYRSMLAAAPSAPATVARCEYCDDTCDIHDAAGEWRGRCQQCAPATVASEAQSGIDSPHNACMHRDDCRTLRAQLAEREERHTGYVAWMSRKHSEATSFIVDLQDKLAEREAEIVKSDARLHEVAEVCATAEQKLAASEARVIAVREAVRQAEISHTGMSYGDDKRGGPSEYTRGWGDCLRGIKADAIGAKGE